MALLLVIAFVQKSKILIKLKLLPHILPFLAACLSLGFLSFESQAQLPQRPPQRAAVASDTLRPRSDTTVAVPDSLKKKGDIETTVKYTARDSTVLDVISKTTYLYGDAQVDYGNISLKADYIELNYLTNITYAKGTLDSTGKLKGTPIFKEGSESYTAEEMRYNFKTKKAIIKGVVTKQGDGNIRGEQVKKDPEDNLYIHNAKYTTCDLVHPHYYINATKIKLVHDKEVVTGPFNLVIADIPTPLGFLFGLFPMTKQKPNGTSGIIVPQYGEEPGTTGRGFFLKGGGYYWAINQYIGMTITGDVFSRGGWGLNVVSNYKKRYSFDGSFNISYSKRRVENTSDASYSIGQDFWITWSHRPVPRGVSSFSASVSAGTSKFNSRNAFAYSTNDYLSSAFRSSVSYSTSFRGTPFRTAINLQQDQNVRTGIMNLTLPAVTLNMNRVYPFKTATSTGKGWWETINVGFDFTGGSFLTNAPTSASSYPFKLATTIPEGTPSFVNSSKVVQDTIIPFNFSNINSLLKRAQIGGSYTVPLSASLKLLRYFSLNPSVSLQGYVYPQRLNFTNTLDGVRVDTIHQFSHAYNFSTSVGLTTRIYGTYNLKGKRIQAIRHTLIPSISMGYSPDFSDPSFGFYQTVISAGKEQRYSRYQGFRNGGPSTGRAGSIGFSINNTLEAKVRAKNDSTGKKFEKVSLLNALNLSGSYNLLADSLKLSNINLSANTRFLKTIDVSMSSTFDPYTYIHTTGWTGTTAETGIKIDKYLLRTQQKLANLSNANIAIGTSFTPGGNKKNDKARTDRVNNADGLPADKQQILNNPNLYVDFNVPWSLRVSYSFNYSKPGLNKATTSQTMSFGGDLSLTPKWKIVFNSGYDFVNKGISYTTINIHRDLHCWEMAFNWTPFGGRQFYSFTINVKSAILKDLKLNRQRSFYDQGFDLRK